jgi:hypothetical protein
MSGEKYCRWVTPMMGASVTSTAIETPATFRRG